MNDAAKIRVTDAIDRLAARGITADALALHPDTARELGVTATHYDWSSTTTHPSADEIADELMDPGYDARGEHDPHVGGGLSKPKAPEEAASLAEARCAKKYRRAVKLAVALDPSLAPGDLVVTGKMTATHAEKA